MVVKTREIQGGEQTGAEETEVRVAQATGEIANIAVTGLLRAAQKGLVTIRQTVKDREKPPELNGQLYKDFRAAFIENGVPEDLASQAAADLVQNKDTESSPAIREANRIVVQGAVQGTDTQTTETKSATSQDKGANLQEDLEAAFIGNEVSEEIAQTAAAAIVDGKDAQSSPAIRAANSMVSKQASVGAIAKESVAPPPQKRAVDFSKPPSALSWKELQSKAKEIREETGQKPASQKKADVEPFVTDYWEQQQAEQQRPEAKQTTEKKQTVAKPILKSKPQQTNAAAPPAQPKLKEIAQDASDQQTSANQADSSQRSTIQRSKLQQMYYDVLAKQKTISPELAELASKDLAEGKGAQSSKHVKIAHDTILDKELSKSGLSKHKRNYSHYSRHAIAANPQQKDVIAASKALQNGLSKKEVRGMITHASPIAIEKYKSSGAQAVTRYVDTVTTHAKVYVSQYSTATQKQASTGKTQQKNKGLSV